eukprot:3444246-Prorocentrum_lima.AAC.1
MTSSLVGSEMCIRDSFLKRKRGDEQKNLWISRVSQTQAYRMTDASSGPVSYTHLTLPTICSV